MNGTASSSKMPKVTSNPSNPDHYLLTMKKIAFLITALALAMSAASATAQPVSEIDLLVGKTMKFYPAGTHLNGFSIEDGEEFIEASRNGAELTLKGLKPGDATLRLALRGGQESSLLVHVKSFHVHPILKPGDPEPEKPKTAEWTGVYEFRLPSNHYSIIYHTFREDGSEMTQESHSCIDDVYVEGECFPSEDGYDGMEDIISIFDFHDKLGYNGGLMTVGEYRMDYGDGNDITPEYTRDGQDWFDMYAPKSLATALYGIDPAGFGRDNYGDDKLVNGTIMQRIRMTGGNQSQLKRFYKGTETVCGRECWVFDFFGKNFYGYGGFCVWVDTETGLVLRHEGEEGGGFIFTRFELDYRDWDIQIRPDLF